ncbi:MAG TPA: hypothetical protein VH724_01160 [Candidatus Angelobacter sp.]|nr:hypothetical protein [Candidatus Angelobacter sp.]
MSVSRNYPERTKLRSWAYAERGGNWFTRSFGAGYPDLDGVVEQLQKRQ